MDDFNGIMVPEDLRHETMRVAELVPYIGNAKKHPDWQVEQIVDSIRAFGFNDPIGVWEDVAGHWVIVEGHGRLLAAKRLGMEAVPVVKLDHLDDEARRAYTLVHNKLTMNTDFDVQIVGSELDAIEGFDMSEFGFETELWNDGEEEVLPELGFNEALGAENNYIVLKFDNDIDWTNALSLFDLKKGLRYSTRTDGLLTSGMRSIGLGRVIDGADAINRLVGSNG